jgi:CarD family transcriptional regulator
MTTAKKTTAGRQGFKTCEAVVYPAHGVGRITAIEEQEIAGYKLELFVVSFEKDKMVLRVPTAKANSVGMRKLAEPELVKKALDLLTGRARVKRTMWSRRAQEYEAKINSGDLLSVTEVVRDLYRSEAQPEQSYSERQLYESALDRVVREISSVNRITETEALKLIEQSLAKSPRRAKGEADPHPTSRTSFGPGASAPGFFVSPHASASLPLGREPSGESGCCRVARHGLEGRFRSIVAGHDQRRAVHRSGGGDGGYRRDSAAIHTHGDGGTVPCAG